MTLVFRDFLDGIACPVVSVNEYIGKHVVDVDVDISSLPEGQRSMFTPALTGANLVGIFAFRDELDVVA